MQHFPEIQLTFEENACPRLPPRKGGAHPGCLPAFPSTRSLQPAINPPAASPVTNLDADDVLEALRTLSEKYLVEKVLGGRTAKYEHCLKHVLSLQDSERAIFTVLLLRGAQTTGELKQRTERIHHFESLDEVEEVLSWFIEYPHGPLVRRIAAGGGRRVETFEHLLSENVPDPSEPAEPPPLPDPAQAPEVTPQVASAIDDDWRNAMENRLAHLEHEIMKLRARLNED